MKVRLLFDENLSERLLPALLELFPQSDHVRRLNAAGASDHTVWELARSGGFVLATRDEDFVGISVMKGAPPKTVWLNVGNARTAVIAQLLRTRSRDIEDFAAHDDYTFLAIDLGTAD